MRNSFNLLLIALAMIDNTYLFSSILESCRKRFDLQTDLHLILLPYFLYPLHSMAMTGRLHLRLGFVIRHLTPNMGSFNNYVDQNLTNFDPLPPRVDKRGHLHTPHPPVHVDKRWIKAPPPPKISTCTSFYSIIHEQICTHFKLPMRTRFKSKSIQPYLI